MHKLQKNAFGKITLPLVSTNTRNATVIIINISQIFTTSFYQEKKDDKTLKNGLIKIYMSNSNLSSYVKTT